MGELVRLLHLADSGIPTGSFAYSYGLESALTFRFVRTVLDLKHYLYAYLQQAVSLDIPFLNSAHGLNLPQEQPRLRLLAAEYDALLLVPGLRKASLVQGKNWLRLLQSFYPGAGLGELQTWCATQQLPVHLVLVLGLGLRQIGLSRQEGQTLYLHMALRDQISAAIRLGFLGSMEGHQLQHDFYALFPEMLQPFAEAEYTEAARSAFLLDAAQVFHDRIYSKLFQN